MILDEKIEDPELERKVDIGFPKIKPSRSCVLQERLLIIKAQRQNPELEKIARSPQQCRKIMFY